jgi:hypothetical protein
VLNPYWDAVSDKACMSERHSWDRGVMVGGDGHWEDYKGRHDLTSRYAWTITDPATVAFVAEQAGLRIIDPLAGTGYWAWLLRQSGADVAASDLNPPDVAKNTWHRESTVHTEIAQADAVDAVTVLGDDRTLLLAWPPYGDPIGAAVLAAYRGPRVVYIGEGEYGCCGGEDMWTAIGSGWAQVAEHRPVQWWGIHDYVTVYVRQPALLPLAAAVTP